MTAKIASDYADIIAEPMCLQFMQEKIDKHAYLTIEQFHNDVMLVRNNCAKYNGEESEFTKVFCFGQSVSVVLS